MDSTARSRRVPAAYRWLGRALDLLLIGVVSIGMTGLVLGRVLPSLGHPVYVVAGPSMAPAIGVGAAVVLERIPAADLRVGDVVTLRSGPSQAVFTHRITRIAELDGQTWLETRGDANAASDPSVTPATAVVGRVALAVPAAGYLLTLLSSLSGVVLVLSTGALLLVSGWLVEARGLDIARRRAVVASASDALPTDVASPAPARPGAARRITTA